MGKRKATQGDWVKLPAAILEFKESKFTKADLVGIVIGRKKAKDSFDFSNNFLHVLTPTNKILTVLEHNLEVVF